MTKCKSGYKSKDGKCVKDNPYSKLFSGKSNPFRMWGVWISLVIALIEFNFAPIQKLFNFRIPTFGIIDLFIDPIKFYRAYSVCGNEILGICAFHSGYVFYYMVVSLLFFVIFQSFPGAM